MADGKVFNFNDQKRIGDVGESDFVKVYKDLDPKKSNTDFRIDFTLNNGLTVELKTDSYDMEKTPNFFMEQLTVSGKNSNLGGPWRSKEHGVDYFVYYFLKNRVFFWFKPLSLCEFLDKFVEEYRIKPISIPNRDNRGGYYEAVGFKIPRESVKPLLLREDKT